MKYIFAIFLVITSLHISAQQQKLMPVIKNGNLKAKKTFFEIQKEFNNYWSPYHIIDGYYYQNGQKIKAAGWKQFKRLEYYWENRVDPKTGKFPTTSSAAIRRQIKKERGTLSSGGNWNSLGPSSSPGGYYGIGRFNCIGFRPGDNNTFYAGSPSGGLWKTTDNANSWIPLTDNNDVLGVSAVVILAGTSTATDTIYIGTGDRDGGSMWSLGGGQMNDNNGIGVLKSVDGGSSWSTTGLHFNTNEKIVVTDILINPNNHNVIYASTYSPAGGSANTGIFKTSNGGISWTRLSANMYVDLELKPNDSQTIYAGTKVGMIYRSTNGGASWTKVLDDYNNGGRRIALAVSSNQPTWVYAVEANSADKLYGVYKSTNNGATFNMIYDGSLTNHNLLGLLTDGSGTTGQGSYDLSLDALPTDANTLYLGGINTFKSTDAGVSWTAVNCWTSYSGYNKNGAPTVHGDKHMLKFRSSDNALFETGDGGIYSTTNGGSSWTDKSNGTVPSQIYRLSVSQTSSSEIIGGLQDDGTKYYSNGNWTNALGGDGMECIIDFNDLNTQYGCQQNGYVYRTLNHWTSSSAITRNASDGNPINGLDEIGYWVTPYVIDPNNHLTIYIGLNNVWKSTNQGNNWTKISSINSSYKIRSLAVSPSNNMVIYAADPSHLYVTTNGGTSWLDITGSLPVNSSSITYVAIKNDDANTAWVTFGQYNSEDVYETTNGGSSWTNISAGLPPIPVMCIIQNKQETSLTELYAGTDVGVYIKRGTTNWTPFNTGLPNVVVNDLDIYYDNNQALSKLRAATYGRGLWESDLYSPPNSPPVTDFTVDKRIPSTTQTVYFYDNSSNSPTSWQWNFSPASITYKNGTTSTSQNPQVQFNTTGYYQVQLTTANAYGNNTKTKTDFIKVSNYCSAYSNGNDYIDEVSVGSIDNSGTGADGYSDYDSLSTQMKITSSYTVTIHFGTAYLHDTIACWIDWNHDGDFDDANEACFAEDIAFLTETGNVTVPNDAALGFTRMRLRLGFQNYYPPCGTTNYGEVEDYAIEVTPEDNVWIGTTNQWNTESNWSKDIIPTMSFNVIIPASPSGGNFPLIPIGFTATCNKITLQSNASITINGILQVNQ